MQTWSVGSFGTSEREKADAMRCLTVGLVMAAMGNGLLSNAAENVPAEAGGETSAVAAESRGSHAANRWRYVWHNDRWWYWTPSERWSYFDGRRWNTYDPRRTAAVASRYRKAAAFERPPAVAPRSPASLPDNLADLVAPFDGDGRALSGTGTSQGGRTPPALGDSAMDRFESDGRRNDLLPHPRSPARMPTRTGNGGFGGPKGGSLGGGSAAGGASTPQ